MSADDDSFLCSLFEQRPMLAVELLSLVCPEVIPDFDEVRLESKDLTTVVVGGIEPEHANDYRRYVVEGRIKEGAESILMVLAAREVEVGDEARERITSCTDLEQLHTWISRAATIKVIDELFE